MRLLQWLLPLNVRSVEPLLVSTRLPRRSAPQKGVVALTTASAVPGSSLFLQSLIWLDALGEVPDVCLLVSTKRIGGKVSGKRYQPAAVTRCSLPFDSAAGIVGGDLWKRREHLSCRPAWVAAPEAVASAAITFCRANHTGNGYSNSWSSGGLKLGVLTAAFSAARSGFRGWIWSWKSLYFGQMSLFL